MTLSTNFIVKLTATKASHKRIGYVNNSGDITDHIFEARIFTFKEQAQAIATAYSSKSSKVSARVIKAPSVGKTLESFSRHLDKCISTSN